MNIVDSLTRPQSCLLGTCLKSSHPDFVGRSYVAYPDRDGIAEERWLAVMEGVDVRDGDEVVLLVPRNGHEPIITGVLQRARPEEQSQTDVPARSAHLADVMQFEDSNGNPILEVDTARGATVIRFLADDLEIAARGKLRLVADSIEMNARDGDVSVESEKDVALTGELIRLNC